MLYATVKIKHFRTVKKTLKNGFKIKRTLKDVGDKVALFERIGTGRSRSLYFTLTWGL
jgi:hypothetical protein